MTRFFAPMLAVGLTLAGGGLAVWSGPARAGDDCGYTTVEGWEVVYDRSCNREISSRVGGLSLSFEFAGSASEPNILRLSTSPNPVSIAVSIGRRRIATTNPSSGHQLTGSALREVFAAMRQKRAVTFAIAPASGSPATVIVDGKGFEAAYQRLIR